MRNLKRLAAAAVAATALLALGAGSATATTLEVGGVPKNSSLSIEASINSGTSVTLEDTNKITVDTCTSSTIKGATSAPFTGATVTAAVSSLTFTGCTHKTTVIKPGTLHIAWTSGTDGAVSSSGAEITVESTIFGASCIAATGTGTNIGILKGVASGNATLGIQGIIPMGLCGDALFRGQYTVTSPAGLGVVS